MDAEIVKALCNAVIILGGNEDIVPILKALQNGERNKELLSKLKNFNLDIEENLKFKLSNRSYIKVINSPTTGFGNISGN